MLINRLRQNQRGDTIVEVMIVLAVLSMAIGISYATANRSLLNARQAQENSMGTAVAQSQVEQIVSIGCTSGNPACDIHNPANPGYQLLHPPASPFCLINGTASASTAQACLDLAPVSGGAVEITCLNSCVPPYVFEVKVSWPDIVGQGTDTVTQDYTIPK